jgi:hypothetical protein
LTAMEFRERIANYWGAGARHVQIRVAFLRPVLSPAKEASGTDQMYMRQDTSSAALTLAGTGFCNSGECAADKDDDADHDPARRYVHVMGTQCETKNNDSVADQIEGRIHRNRMIGGR